ncbi:hypothetical protein EMIT07CA2_20203 [Brevibacillus sp. IT-7CA2]
MMGPLAVCKKRSDRFFACRKEIFSILKAEVETWANKEVLQHIHTRLS